ncbi:MAG: uracil-DNA glycosylase family protein [Caldimonas sp.]
MRWTERQRAMLREMGIPLWAPDVDAQVAVATAVAEVAAPVAAPAREDTGAAVAPTRTRLPEPAAARLPGLAPADWLVVAEPLDEADPQQQQLLDNMLRAIGVGLIAPGRERRAVFCALVGGGANGKTSAADQAMLEASIATVAPRCVLAFGRHAAAALLGDDTPLGGLRGRAHVHAGVPVVVTFSLAFLLRHPAEKAKAWADLCLAVGSLADATA